MSIDGVISKAKLLDHINECANKLYENGGYVGSGILVILRDDIESGTFDLHTDADVKEIEESLNAATYIEDWKAWVAMVRADTLRQLLTKLAETEAELADWKRYYEKLSESKQRLVKAIQNGEEIHFATLDGESNANT